jgi:hypothetical protein
VANFFIDKSYLQKSKPHGSEVVKHL